MTYKAGWLDRAIAWVSPETGERRVKAALRLEAAQRARSFYDGATKGRRMDGWRRPSTGPGTEIRGALRTLRDGSRDLVRNNPWAARGISAVPSHAVGYGIVPALTHRNKRAQARLRELATLHFDTPAIDAAGRHNLYGLQFLAMRGVAESGEILARRRWRRPSDNLPLPFQVELLESDYLDTSKDGPLPNGHVVVDGIEFDLIARRVAYWLFDEHPGDRVRHSLRSTRVPAEDVTHVYRVDRPGQNRGVPWLAPAIATLRDFADYEDAQLLRQKLAACFAAFEVDNTAGSEESIPPPNLEMLEPGIYERLPPGRDIRFPNMPTVEGYADFSRIQTRKIAITLDMPEFVLTGDYSAINFSSGRLGWNTFMDSVEYWRWSMLIPQLCDRIAGWFFDAANLLVPGGVAGAACAWTAPKRQMISPQHEVPAIKDAIRSGLMTPSEAVRERGYDAETFWDEYRRDLAQIADLNLDSDPRKPANGNPAPSQGDDGKPQDNADGAD